MWSKFEQHEFPSRCNVIKALDTEPKRFYARFPIALAPQKTTEARVFLNYQNHRLLIDPVNRGFIMWSGNLIHGGSQVEASRERTDDEITPSQQVSRN